MLLRRLASALRKQDWLSLFLELVIVVAGIYLGLQASQWAEEADARLREHEHLQALLVDFEKSTKDLKAALEYKQIQIADLQELLTEGHAQVGETRLREIVYRGVYATNTFVPTLSALRDLEASGNLGLISDPAIRRGISQLSAEIDAVDRSFKEYLFFHQNDLDPFIARNLPVVAFLSEESGAAVQAVGEEDWSALDSELARGLLVFKMSLAKNYADALEGLNQRFRELITLIGAALSTN
jgi:hypothetical protein